MRQIVLDTETTGIETKDGNRIIEVGCIELINRKFTGKRYHQYINPERESEEGALAVHGITTQFLQDKPVFRDVAQEIMDFISGAELIIHNAPFDIGFLNYEFGLLNQKWKPITEYCRVVDSLVLAKQLHIGQRNSLDALCKRYGVDNSHREMHGALLDAHLLAQVYLAMTGGQGSLFGNEMAATESNSAQHEKTRVFLSHSHTLKVLKADAEELLAHEEHLQRILNKGKCVWLE